MVYSVSVDRLRIWTPRFDLYRAELIIHAAGVGNIDSEMPVWAEVAGPECRFTRTIPDRMRVPAAPIETAGDGWSAHFQSQLIDPCLWSPVHPFRYVVHVGVGDPAQEILAVRTVRFGIRAVQVQNQQLLLNGESWRPVLWEPPQGSLAAARIMKLREMGITGVCLPVDALGSELLDECDAAGMVVFGRLNRENAARVGELQPHPSLLAWVVQADEEAGEWTADPGRLWWVEDRDRLRLRKTAGDGVGGPAQATLPIVQVDAAEPLNEFVAARTSQTDAPGCLIRSAAFPESRAASARKTDSP